MVHLLFEHMWPMTSTFELLTPLLHVLHVI